MKDILDKIIKPKKAKKAADEKATEAMVEAIVQEVKKEAEVVKYPKPNHFPDCKCFKCMRWQHQENAAK